jgi:GT2 family glycosyltransferase
MLRYHDRDRVDASPERPERAGRLGLRAVKLADDRLEGPVVECHWAAVGCMLMTRRYIETTGIIQAMEPYFLYGDPVWYLMAFRHGLRLGYVPRATVWHKGSRSLKRMGPARLRWAMRDYVILWYRFWRLGYFKGLHLPILVMYLYWIFLRRPLDMPVMVLRNIGWAALGAIARGFIDAIASLFANRKGKATYTGKQ